MKRNNKAGPREIKCKREPNTVVGLLQTCVPSSEAENVFPGFHTQAHMYSMYMCIYADGHIDNHKQMQSTFK